MTANDFVASTGAGWWMATAAVFVLAGTVKGVIGLGLPTLSMALLALWMTPSQAAALLIVPSLVTNAWQMRPWSTLLPIVRRLGGMQCGICVGTLLGAALLGAPAGALATACLGATLLVYAVVGLSGRVLHVSAGVERWLSPVIGVITGGVTAATGVFVVPAVPYLQSLGMRRDALIQAMGLSFTVSTVVLAAGLGANHVYTRDGTMTSVAMLVPALIGMSIGQWLRPRLSVVTFRRCFFVSTALLGTFMAGSAWFH